MSGPLVAAAARWRSERGNAAAFLAGGNSNRRRGGSLAALPNGEQRISDEAFALDDRAGVGTIADPPL
ncbi:hypothetical protein [Xanthomonas albilineans]|uniref:hypothetical protein n=1 Tax=Xanthomonas albilineans TaxID=29447 RepID=UPI0005F32B60|nr:hypothetical protein [Xanthomonas albilineans]